jgi:NADH:ubiquinone oxidoreductase subunit 5 (subunit L)/multisubunit Na+/H+ antiporter MnhA subunit
MPVTFACFFVAALSISGIPPFNGFFSKELIYDAALERGWIFYAAAVLGSFFTAASFLKLGHAAYFGEPSGAKKVKEASLPILIPMITLASICIFFGLFNSVPINGLIVPLLKEVPVGHHFAGWPTNSVIVMMTFLVLLFALIIHLFNTNKNVSALKAADYIHYAPGFKQIYDAAEKHWLDPYDIGMKLIGLFSRLAFLCDRGIDWIYSGLSVSAGYAFSYKIRQAHNGNYSFYLVWSVVGSLGVILYLLFTH